MSAVLMRSVSLLLLGACTFQDAELSGKECLPTLPCPTGYVCEPGTTINSPSTCQKGIAFQDSLLPSEAYAGTEDVTVASDAPSANFASSIDVEFDILEYVAGNPSKNGLLKWDVRSVPPGSQVRAVRIDLFISNNSLGELHGVFTLERPWTESEATWSEASRGVGWEGVGASGPLDRGAQVALAAPSKMGAYPLYLDPAGIARVQQWVDEPSSNHGIVFVGTSDNGGAFRSHRSPTVEERPRLMIFF